MRFHGANSAVWLASFSILCCRRSFSVDRHIAATKSWKGEKSSKDDYLMIVKKQMRAETTAAVMDGVGLTMLDGRWQAD